MDILGSLLKTSTGNRFVVVITDRYSKLTRAVPTKTNTAPQIVTIFMGNWAMPYGIPEFHLTDNGAQFFGKFFNSMRLYLSTKLLTATSFHLQAN